MSIMGILKIMEVQEDDMEVQEEAVRKTSNNNLYSILEITIVYIPFWKLLLAPHFSTCISIVVPENLLPNIFHTILKILFQKSNSI